jgi:hypothetical protein
MHFTGINPLNLPFFLYQSLGNMVDNVQAKADQLGNNLSHFSLTKLLISEEFEKMELVFKKNTQSFKVSGDT